MCTQAERSFVEARTAWPVRGITSSPLLILQGIASASSNSTRDCDCIPLLTPHGIATFPSNTTRDCPPSLPILRWEGTLRQKITFPEQRIDPNADVLQARARAPPSLPRWRSLRRLVRRAAHLRQAWCDTIDFQSPNHPRILSIVLPAGPPPLRSPVSPVRSRARCAGLNHGPRPGKSSPRAMPMKPLQPSARLEVCHPGWPSELQFSLH